MSYFIKAAGVLLLSVFASTSIIADELPVILDTNKAKLDDAVKSQVSIDNTHQKTAKLLQDYRDITNQNDALIIYNQQLEKQIDSQLNIIQQLDHSISQVSVIERQLPALMLRMMNSLEQFIELDAPFHLKERQQRIQHLKTNLVRADISEAEKFRQLLEAYKIENEYGRKIDHYQDSVDIDGQIRMVNILRVGRIALLYQSRDGENSGMWDRSTKRWITLDAGEYRHAIIRGLRVAKKQSAIELLTLPISMAGPKS